MTEETPKSQVDVQREHAADSQQEPQQDSGLQTPQPDQPMPTEAERSASSTSDPGEANQDAPEDYEPQTSLQSDQVGGIQERPGEQVSDVEESVDDQSESPADQNDDEAVDDTENT